MRCCFNELDKIKVGIPPEKYRIKGAKNSDYLLGCNYKVKENKMLLEMSGKINAAPNNLGSITLENIEKAVATLKNYGVEINLDYLLEDAELYRVDVKKDLEMDDNPSNYISALKEVFKACSDKYNINTYKKVKYFEGLELCPVAKSAKHKISMYAKYPEILSKRHSDKGYFSQFDYEFLEQSKNTLRTEIQLHSFDEIRKSFQISKQEPPTLEKVFDYDGDVVNERLAELKVF